MTSWYVKCSMMATARSWRFHGVACGDRKVQSIQQHHRLHDLMRELGSLDFDKAFLVISRHMPLDPLASRRSATGIPVVFPRRLCEPAVYLLLLFLANRRHRHEEL